MTSEADVKCYGNAKPGDLHLAADIVAIDDEIVTWLRRQQREQPQKITGANKQ
jgi:hypothetical protein